MEKRLNMCKTVWFQRLRNVCAKLRVEFAVCVHVAVSCVVLDVVFGVLLGVLLGIWGTSVVGAEMDSKTWRTGTSYSQALEARIGLAWDEMPIREALDQLAKQTHVAIWLDRRVDVNRPVSGTFRNASLPQILRETAHSGERKTESGEKLELTQLGSVLYVGPARFVRLVRTLSTLKQEELKEKTSKNVQKKWLASVALSWPRLAQPAEILKGLAEEQGVEFSGLKEVPHDLWPERALPEMSVLNAALLILGQFDLTLEFRSEGAFIVPLVPENVVLTKSFASARVTEERLERIREQVPETRFAKREKKVAVRGILEVHEFLQSELPTQVGVSIGSFTPSQSGFQVVSGDDAAGNSDSGSGNVGTSKRKLPKNRTVTGRTPDGNERSLLVFTGTLKHPFYPLIQELCRQNGMKLTADVEGLVASGVALEQIVTVELQEATIEELFQKLGEAAGCNVRVEGEEVIVRPAGSTP